MLAIIKKRSDKPTLFHLKKLRKSIEDCENTSVEHSGFFGGVETHCIKIPRKLLDKDLLRLIDKGITKKLYFVAISVVPKVFVAKNI